MLYDSYSVNGLDRESVLRISRKYHPFIEKYSPEFIEEAKGIAEAIDSKLEDILMDVSYPETFDDILFRKGCSAFAATGEATVKGETYVGQTWDDDPDWWLDGQSAIFLEKRYTSGPSILIYTWPGIPHSAGINTKGIALSWNTIHCEEKKLGVPTFVIVYDLLRQNDMCNVFGSVLRGVRAEAFNFVVGDKEGQIYNIEATPKNIEFISDIKYLVHTNHIIYNKGLCKDIVLPFCPDSVLRYNRLRNLMSQKDGKLNVETLMEVLRDHVNYPYSICKHADKKAVWGRTFAAWIQIPAKGEMWICRGNPCENKFMRHTIR